MAPIGFNDVVRTLLIGSAISLVVAPVAGWQSFLITLAFPSPGISRLAAVLRIWTGTSLLLGAMFVLMKAGFDYAPSRPGPHPWAGFLLADFSVSMLVSCGVWGTIAPVLSGDIAIRGALITGCVVSVVVALLGYMLVG